MHTNRFAQVATFSVGLLNLIVTLIMFSAPRWFFENVGHFPPFNRHYLGDTASFLLPLAVGLLIAARDPARYRLVIGMGAAASVLHTFNHLYDPLIDQSFNQAYNHILDHAASPGYWLLEFTPLVLIAAALIAASYQPERRQRPVLSG